MTKTPPDGFHSITPYIVVGDGDAAIALYQKAFDAELCGRLDMPGTKTVLHSCLRIGNSNFFVSDESAQMGMVAPKSEVGTRFYVYVPDVDASHKQATDAGLKENAAPETMFWGDRTSVLEDPWGHRWTLATHVKDVSEAEMAEAMKQMAG